MTHETGRISVDLAIDDSGGPTWRDSLIDEAGAKIARVDEDHGGSAAAPAAGSGGPSMLGQAVNSLGHVVNFVDHISEVSSVAGRPLASTYMIVICLGPSVLQNGLDHLVRCVQGRWTSFAWELAH